MSEFAWGSGDVMEWPFAMIPEKYRQVQPSDVETLLVSGNIDTTTPAQWATNELLPSLSNGKQVILSEFGHTDDIWGLQPEATRHLLKTFFDTGEVDDSLFTYQPMSFEVGLMSFPRLAKVLVAALFVVPALLFVLVRAIVRRLKRRNPSRVTR